MPKKARQFSAIAQISDLFCDVRPLWFGRVRNQTVNHLTEIRCGVSSIDSSGPEPQIHRMKSDISIAARLAKRLRDTRKSKGLSLEATAKLSGVSRSMLSQIERGESSPTVATLWCLTQALQVDFAGLLDDKNAQNPIKEVMRANRTPTIDSQGEGCRIRILSPPEQAGQVEVYEITLANNGVLKSAPHRSGCVEHLTVLKGELEIVAGNDSEIAKQGDTIRYAADCPHILTAIGGNVTVLLVVHNS